FFRQLAKPVVFPPRDLVFSAMPLEQVSHDTSRLVLRSASCWIIGDVAEEPLHQFEYPGALLIDGFGGLVRLNYGPGDDIAASDQIMADIFKPVPQLECGNAIFTVVGLNGLANVLR